MRIIIICLLLLSATFAKAQTPNPKPEITITSIEDGMKQLKAFNKEILAAKTSTEKEEVFKRFNVFVKTLFSTYTEKEIVASFGPAACAAGCLVDYSYCLNRCWYGPGGTNFCSTCDPKYNSCLSGCFPSNN